MKKPLEAPTLETLGTITELTGTWGGEKNKCVDLGWSDEKNIGYPSDQFWKLIPICDQPGDGGVS